MSANFSSDSIVWVDGQVTLPKHILKILGIENGHRSNVTFIVENGEVKIVIFKGSGRNFPFRRS